MLLKKVSLDPPKEAMMTKDEMEIWLDAKATKLYLSKLEAYRQALKENFENLLSKSDPFETQTNMAMNAGIRDGVSWCLDAESILMEEVE